MKQLCRTASLHLSAKRIDIYGNIIIAFANGLATLTPVETLPNVSGSDKLYHLISFASLTLLIAIIRPNYMWIILCLSIAFGSAIELLQPLVNRSCEMVDFLADGVGAILGFLVAGALRARPRPTPD